MGKFLKLFKNVWKYKDQLSETGTNFYKLTLYLLGAIVLIGSSYGIYKVYERCLIPPLKGFFEGLFVIIISCTTSLFVSSLFAVYQLLLDLSLSEEANRRKRFQSFFRCDTNNQNAKDKVVIVLPSYSPPDPVKEKPLESEMKNSKEVIREKLENEEEPNIEIEKEIANLSEDLKVSSNKGKWRKNALLNSVKIFRDQRGISFSQYDTIAAAEIVALFSRMNMRLPVIRTDVQALCKIFQNAFNITSNEGIEDKIRENIKPEVFKASGLEIEIQRALKLIRKHTVYETYISIGMFSNIFFMDFINDNICREVNKRFTCAIYKSSPTSVRRIFLNWNDDTVDPIDEEPNQKTDTVELAVKDIEYDYALIARAKYKNKQIIICGGITAEGTEAASMYLSERWEKIHSKVSQEPFAIILQLNLKNWDRKSILSKAVAFDFPAQFTADFNK